MYGSLLVETGALGLFVFLVMCAVILRTAWRFGRSTDPLLALQGSLLLAGWCGFMIQMLSGDTLTYWRVTPAYFVLLGAAVRCPGNEEGDSDDQDRPEHQQSHSHSYLILGLGLVLTPYLVKLPIATSVLFPVLGGPRPPPASPDFERSAGCSV